MRFSLILLLLAGCASATVRVERGALSPDTVIVMPTRNLSSVTLKVPEIYLGDAPGSGAGLPFEHIDVALLAEAATLARLRETGCRAELEQHAARFGSTPRFEVHSAITDFDLTELRQTGRIRMAMTVMLVDAINEVEIARGSVAREYQLMDVAPDEAGAVGEHRFIESRLQMYTESLAREAVDAAGF